MIDNSAFNSAFVGFKSRYADDDACRRRLFEIIWPDGRMETLHLGLPGTETRKAIYPIV
jgi:hypothetical protein